MLKKVPTQVDLVATLQAHDPFLKAAPSLLNFFWMWIVLLVHVSHPINRLKGSKRLKHPSQDPLTRSSWWVSSPQNH